MTEYQISAASERKMKMFLGKVFLSREQRRLPTSVPFPLQQEEQDERRLRWLRSHSANLADIGGIRALVRVPDRRSLWWSVSERKIPSNCLYAIRSGLASC